jgi:hypothetical protein
MPLLLSAALYACDDDFRECRQTASETAQLPELVSETGLYSDIAGDVLAPGVQAYTPSFALWSDGADKRRFIALPTAAQIDTTDMDEWQFPVGTKLWKEFTRDGVRVETRLEQKLAEATWGLVAYVWNDDESDATQSTTGVENAHGTPHDVPRASDCQGCHAGRRSSALGFSAIQLAHTAEANEVDLQELIDRELLTRPPMTMPRVPGSTQQVAGLGYLHANCSHCHNQTRPDNAGPRCYDPDKSFDFTLRVGELASLKSTALYRTAVDGVIEAGNAKASKVIERMSARNPDTPTMPPLATERVDEAGVASVRALIESL